jgi:glyoxylase I family protein
MPMQNPPRNYSSPFASFRGHHVGLRVRDFEAARDWYVDTLDFRVLHSWTGLGLSWAYLSPAADDSFHIELMGGPVEHEDTPVLDSVIESLSRPGYLHFCLEVADVEATIAELQNTEQGCDRHPSRHGEPRDQPQAGLRPGPVGQHDRTRAAHSRRAGMTSVVARVLPARPSRSRSGRVATLPG